MSCTELNFVSNNMPTHIMLYNILGLVNMADSIPLFFIPLTSSHYTIHMAVVAMIQQLYKAEMELV